MFLDQSLLWHRISLIHNRNRLTNLRFVWVFDLENYLDGSRREEALQILFAAHCDYNTTCFAFNSHISVAYNGHPFRLSPFKQTRLARRDQITQTSRSWRRAR